MGFKQDDRIVEEGVFNVSSIPREGGEKGGWYLL